MPEHIQYEDDDLFNPETHHEATDVPVSALLKFIAIFIVFSIVSYFIVLFLYKALAKGERNRMDPPATAIARPDDAAVPKNQPLLQPFPREAGKGAVVPPQAATPVVDLIEMRAAEERVLKNYGWVDKEHGIVHIPISEAKGLLAARIALQAQTGAASATTTSTAAPEVAPGSTPSPAGAPVPPDTGATHSATTNTAGGTHQ